MGSAERNKEAAMAFYDLMFNQSQPTGYGVASLGLGEARWGHPEGERLHMRWVHFDEGERRAG